MTDRALLNSRGWTQVPDSIDSEHCCQTPGHHLGTRVVLGKAAEGCCCGLNYAPLKPHAEALTPQDSECDCPWSWAFKEAIKLQ